jgi:hypothetical protein
VPSSLPATTPPPQQAAVALPAPPTVRDPNQANPPPATSPLTTTAGEPLRPPPPPAPTTDAPFDRAAPAPPPATSVAPVRRTPTPEEAVRATLAAYEAAYEQRDLAALRRVFPGLPAQQGQALTQAFENAASYRLELRILGLNVADTTATAACEVTHALVPKVGNASRNTQGSTFHLALANGQWVIERVEPSNRR